MPTGTPPAPILDSWQRSRAAGVERRGDVPGVSTGELDERLTLNGALCTAALPHLDGLARVLPGAAVAVADREGVVLLSLAADGEMVARTGLRPGMQRAESAVGTTALGICLATGRPAWVGAGHHHRADWHPYSACAAPVLDEEQTVLGVVELVFRADGAEAERLALASQAAFAVGRELQQSQRGQRLARPGPGALTPAGSEACRDDAGMRILVVDDDPASRELLTVLLSPRYRVLTAADGAGALEVLQREPVDLVLSDVMMPGMSGYEVCERVKQHAGSSYLPVILLTALGEQDDRNRGLGAGADEFLTKPVDRVELLLRVRSLLAVRAQDHTIRRQLSDLQKLNAVKDDLVSLVVHDLRNPLNSLQFNLELARRQAESTGRAPLVGALQNIRMASARLNELLDDVLQVRLLEEGKLPIQRQPLAMRGLMTAALATLDGVARQLNVSVVLECPDHVVAVVDRRLARRTVENVLVNALTHSPEGSTVEVVVGQRGTELLVVDICDRGPGVPDELKARIFEKFGTVEARRSETRRSHGLGLFFVNLAVSAHGGSVAVLDRDGGGSVFRLTFPLTGNPR
ncbi:MAG: response regulator [Myxococcota bacterium]